jgi:SPW repeat-containing protein
MMFAGHTNRFSTAPRRREAILALYNSLLGAFLFVAPWIFTFPLGRMRLDAWITGAILSIFSAATFLHFAKWEEWINLLIGCWILASPWVLNFQHTPAMHVAIGVGAVVVYLSMLELWLVRVYFDSSELLEKSDRIN